MNASAKRASLTRPRSARSSTARSASARPCPDRTSLASSSARECSRRPSRPSARRRARSGSESGSASRRGGRAITRNRRRASSPGASRRAGLRFRGPQAPSVRRDAGGGVLGWRATDPTDPAGSGASQAPTPSAASDARAAVDVRSGIIRARSSDSISPAVCGCSFRKLRALSRPCPMRSLP